MKRSLIIFSHLGSGSELFYNCLYSHPRIDGFRTGQIYDHYDKIVNLTENRHKNENSASIWMDEVLHNYQFTCKPLLKHIKSIFFIREPRGTLASILKKHPEYDIQRASDYYRYRLRGICEYANRCKESPIVLYEKMDLKKVEKHLNIEGLTLPVIDFDEIHVPLNILKKCEESYENHLKHLF